MRNSQFSRGSPLLQGVDLQGGCLAPLSLRNYHFLEVGVTN
jgi:hypothetical protein